MKILLEVFSDLIGMFIADARMSAAILVLVGIVAALIFYGVTTPLISGAVLLVGCLLLIIVSTLQAARKAR